MKLVVGLGNPGKEYSKTRHNCGFMALDYFSARHSLEFKKKFNGEYVEFLGETEKIILVKPQTFMNLSGDCVKKYCNYYDINTNDILVIYDDVDFEVGHFKIKKDGSSAGHNGINDIINKLKTQEVSRVRIGISKNKQDKADYVLGKLGKAEVELINKVIITVNNIIEDYSSCDINKLMEKYNREGNEGKTI